MSNPPRKFVATIDKSNAPTRARRSTLVDMAVTACILAARTAAADQSTPMAGNTGGSELAEVTVTA
jgi:hypothetical protein